jgi:hypothetical protein
MGGLSVGRREGRVVRRTSMSSSTFSQSRAEMGTELGIL